MTGTSHSRPVHSEISEPVEITTTNVADDTTEETKKEDKTTWTEYSIFQLDNPKRDISCSRRASSASEAGTKSRQSRREEKVFVNYKVYAPVRDADS